MSVSSLSVGLTGWIVAAVSLLVNAGCVCALVVLCCRRKNDGVTITRLQGKTGDSDRGNRVQDSIYCHGNQSYEVPITLRKQYSVGSAEKS